MRQDGLVPYHPMTAEEIQAFLTARPARTGKLATTRKDGRPHVAPIWFVVDEDGSILFNTGASTVKGRNLRRTGRAALCVDNETPPFDFVTLEGRVEISDDLALVRHWAGVIGARYMGADRREDYAARNGVPGELLVRFIPDKVVSAADLAE